MESDTNVGLGMVPHKKACRCLECENERHEAEIKDLNSKLAALSIDHPTDICECRFDFSGGEMKVKHQCAYHKGIADRLDTLTADRDQWKGRADQLQEERDEAQSRLEAVLKLARDGTPDAETRGDEDGHYAQGQIDLGKAIKALLVETPKVRDGKLEPPVILVESNTEPNGPIYDRFVENPVTIATDRTNERQTCNHCGNPVPCACW